MLSSLWNSSSDKQIGSDWFHSIALTLTKIFPLKWMAKRLLLVMGSVIKSVVDSVMSSVTPQLSPWSIVLKA